MAAVETLLTQWRSLYAEWVLAELQLREARQRGRGSRALAVLEARVGRLQRECKAALDETSAALSSANTSTPVTFNEMSAARVRGDAAAALP